MITRISESALPNALRKNGETWRQADIEKFVSLLRTGVNENFNVLQKIIGSKHDDVYVVLDSSDVNNIVSPADRSRVIIINDYNDYDLMTIREYDASEEEWSFVDTLSIYDVYQQWEEYKTRLETIEGTLYENDNALVDTVAYLATEIVKKLDTVSLAPQVVASEVEFSSDVQFGTPPKTPGVYIGNQLISWNDVEGTYNMSLLNGVTLQAGQELHFYGKAYGNIDNMDVVMFGGVQGDHILLKKADMQSEGFKPEFVIGVATQSISNGSFGYVTWFGRVNDIPVDYVAGTLLYLHPTIPGLLTIKDNITEPNHRILIAAVEKQRTGGASNGIILVRPTFSPKLSDLSDVKNNASNGAILNYDGDDGCWEPSNRLTTAEEDISTLEGHMDTAKSDINGIKLSVPFLDPDTGKIPAVYLPSYVDDVEEYADYASLPVAGEMGKLYVTLDTQTLYRWTGSVYVALVTAGVVSVNDKTGVVNLGYGDVGAAQDLLNKITNGIAYWNNTSDRLDTSENLSYDGTDLKVSSKKVATRQDAPIDNGIPYWNDAKKRFDTDTGLTYDSANNTLYTAYFRTGYGMYSTGGLNNAYVNTALSGTVISRNIADSNPALKVNLTNAGATGNIVEFQAESVKRSHISRSGDYVGRYVEAFRFYYPSNDLHGKFQLSNTTGMLLERNINDANPTLIVNNANTGSTADIQRWQLGGSTKAVLTYDGKLGIGTDSLGSYRLKVEGTGFFNGSLAATSFLDASNGNFYLDPANNTTSLNVAGNIAIATSKDLVMGGLSTLASDGSNNYLKVGVKMYIQNQASTVLGAISSDGKVGIGTTTPSEKLDVSGSIKTSGAVKFGSNAYMQYNATDESIDFIIV